MSGCTSLKKRSLRRRIVQRGYTAVEILISMTVFAIGASGVIAMQQAAVKGNYDARTLDLASSLSRQWQERLRRDAMYWTTTGTPNNTTWLGSAASATATPAWFIPAYPSSGSPEGLSPAFDVLGRDLTLAEGTGSAGEVAIFCTQVKLQRMGNQMVRAQVRVVWERGGGTLKCLSTFDPSDPGNTDQVTAGYRSVTTVNMLRGNF